MKRPMLLSGLTLALLAIPLLALAETPLAVLMSVTGNVTVVKAGGNSVPGTFGYALEAGDEVRTGAASSAEILFEAGSLIQIGANSSTTIKGSKKPVADAAKGAAGVQTASLNDKSFDQVQNFLKLKDAQGSSSLVGLRSGEKDSQLEPTSPMHTKIRAARPVFEWRGSEDAGEVQLKLYSDKGEVWNHTITDGRRVEYPADAPELKSGLAYSWTVESTDPLLFPPLRSQAVFFEVMSSAESEDVNKRLATIKKEQAQNESTYHVVRASLFYSFGLMDEAINDTIAALKNDADNDTLKAILARLYTEVGRTNDALGEYDQLLDSK